MRMSDQVRRIPVTDVNDPRIEEFHSIRDRDLRGSASRPGLFIGEAVLVVKVMLERKGMTRSVLTSEPQADRMARLIADSESPDTPLYVASTEIMNGITGFPIHRGVLASGHRPDPANTTLERILPDVGKDCTILVCDGINNIDNIGLLFRNAAAFGVDAVILSPDCHDPLYRKSIRVSIGHALRIPFHRSTDWASTLRVLSERHRMRIIGTSIDDRSTRLDEMERPRRTALVMGGEFEGLGPEALSACDALVRIPMTPGTDSLNVGVAAAVCLHRFSHAHRV